MSSLDIKLTVTRFLNQSAAQLTEQSMSLREFAALLPTITAKTKRELPWFKLGKFGRECSAKGSYRTDRNMLQAFGCELDYDAAEVSFAVIAQALHVAKIPGVLITTASHRPEATRCRFYAAFSQPIDPAERGRMVSRIVGALPPEIEFAGESWTRSQAFYAGVTANAPAPLEIVLIDGEGYAPVDLRDDLDQTARAKPRPNRTTARPSPRPNGNGAAQSDRETHDPDDPLAFDPGEDDNFDIAVATVTIMTCSPGMHDALRSFTWHYATHDLPAAEIEAMLYDLYGRTPEGVRDERWQRDWNDIPRTVASAVEKIVRKRANDGEGTGQSVTWAGTHAKGNGADDGYWSAKAEPEPPDPLVAPTQPQRPYPLDALAHAPFVDTVRAVARVVEGDVSMVGTVTLSSMSASVSKLALGVEIEDGLVSPGALFTADIVGSSERKTSAERRVYAGIEAFVTDVLTPEYQQQLKAYLAAQAIYERDKRSILSKRGAETKQQQAGKKGKGATTGRPPADDPMAFDAGGSDTLTALLGLEEPVAPDKPFIVTNDFTIEGMRDAMASNGGQLAVVTSEGAVVFGGWSLGDKTRRPAGVGSLSRGWDGLDDNVARAGGRNVTVKQPRLTLSIGVQPRIAATFFADLDLRDQGIVNRFLVTWPEPMAGSRKLDPLLAEDLVTIRQFNEQAQACLRISFGLAGGLAGGQLSSRARMRAALPLSPEARALWRDYAKAVERGQAKGQPYEHITGWAGKAAEQAARIALILTLFADPAAQVVEEPAMAGGIQLAWWYCDEWVRICEVVEPSLEQKQAVRVMEWLRETYSGKSDEQGRNVSFTARDLYTSGVAGIGTREAADRVLELLGRHGLIVTDDPPKPKRRGRILLVRWRLF
jgi:hypothetical protein